MLRADSPLVDIFHALRKMNGNHEEIRVHMKFQMRDRNKVYSELVSSLAGQVSRLIFDLVKCECFRMERPTFGAIDDEIVTFTDTFQVSGARNCTCPFFLQYSAPFAHLWKIAGEAATNLFHPAWKVGTGSAPQAAIMYGPWNEPKLSMEDAKYGTYLDMIADLQAKLLDLGMDAGMPFIRKFSAMIDQGMLNAPRTIKDPPVSKARGRPKRARENTFKGTFDF